MSNWIVFEKPSGKLDAVESDHTVSQRQELDQVGFTIVGYPACKTKDDAISFMEAILGGER